MRGTANTVRAREHSVAHVPANGSCPMCLSPASGASSPCQRAFVVLYNHARQRVHARHKGAHHRTSREVSKRILLELRNRRSRHRPPRTPSLYACEFCTGEEAGLSWELQASEILLASGPLRGRNQQGGGGVGQSLEQKHGWAHKLLHHANLQGAFRSQGEKGESGGCIACCYIKFVLKQISSITCRGRGEAPRALSRHP